MAKIDFHREKIEKPKTTRIKSIVGENYLNNFKCRFQTADKIAKEKHKALIESKYVILLSKEKQENFRLHLVIGENIPLNSPEKFNMISLYVKDENDNLNLYANITLPYLINHLEFLDIKDEPRYFLKEDYNLETNECKNICELIPFGTMKGVYQILNGQSIKIENIEPLFELENNVKVHTLTKKKK